MKKIICLCLVVLLFFTFAGCGSGMDSKDEDQNVSSMFVMIEHDINYGYPYTVVYHKETKVMYALDQYNHFTVMVDAEGKPLLYSEDLY